MSNLTIRQQAARADRRRSARFVTEIPVVLRTVLGNRDGFIANISDQGAMLDIESPPPEGIAACLILGEDEFFCTVRWSREGSCGVEFERAIADGKLDAIAGEEIRRTGTIANHGNIQRGRKRGRLVSRE